MDELERRQLFATTLTVGDPVNTSKLLGNQVEASIVIDPTNPNNLFIASNNDGPGLFGAFSTNGGATWTSRTLADGTDGIIRASSDPTATFDEFGNLFLGYLDSKGSAVVIVQSVDGGQHFTPMARIAGNVDQPTITARSGMLWLTVARGGVITATGAPVAGLGSVGAFGVLQKVPNSKGGSFGDIAISGQNVTVAYQRPAVGEHRTKLFVSTDPDGLGPAGFSDPVALTATNVGGFDHIPPQSDRSIDAEIGLAYDNSGGAFSGRLYAVYNNELPDESGNTDVFLRFSDDNGGRWSKPLRVNDDSGTRSQFLPRIAVDQTTGNVAITWLDSRKDNGVVDQGSTDEIANNEAVAFGTVAVPLTGGNIGIAPNVQIGKGPSNAATADSGIDHGDYGALDFHGGVFVTAWADNFNSTNNNPDGDLGAFDMLMAQVAVSVPVGEEPPATEFAASSNAPKVTITRKPVVARGTNYTFTATFTDDVALDLRMLTNPGLSVTGPNYSQTAEIVKLKKAIDGTRAVLTLRITPTHSQWLLTDNGTYSIVLADNAIADTEGNFIAGGVVATFNVNSKIVPLPQGGGPVPL